MKEDVPVEVYKKKKKKLPVFVIFNVVLFLISCVAIKFGADGICMSVPWYLFAGALGAFVSGISFFMMALMYLFDKCR